MGHLGLATLGAYTAPDFIAAAKTLLVGDTSHNWTWLAEAGAGGDAGVDVALYGERAVTGGKLIVAIAGNVAGGTPGGTITPDVGAGDKVWGGCGFVPTGSAFVWAGWTAANPTTNGTWAGWSPICTPTAASVARKVQLWTHEGGLIVRPEATTTTTSRVMLIGDMLLPYTDAGQRLVTAPTPQAHGACIGWWTVSSLALTAAWISAVHSADGFGFNNTTANQVKGRYLDGTTLRPCKLHLPIKAAPTATNCVASGKAGGLAVYVQRDDTAPDDTFVGIHPHIVGADLRAGGEVQVGGIPVLLIVSRHSAAAGDQALLLSVARRSRAL
jgi:hypothetical protein